MMSCRPSRDRALQVAHSWIPSPCSLALVTTSTSLEPHMEAVKIVGALPSNHWRKSNWLVTKIQSWRFMSTRPSPTIHFVPGCLSSLFAQRISVTSCFFPNLWLSPPQTSTLTLDLLVMERRASGSTESLRATLGRLLLLSNRYYSGLSDGWKHFLLPLNRISEIGCLWI